MKHRKAYREDTRTGYLISSKESRKTGKQSVGKKKKGKKKGKKGK